MKVLFLSPEAVPFAKTGGLADVAGSLPGALQRQDVDVRMVLPFYRMVREGNFEMSPLIDVLPFSLGDEDIEARVLETHTQDEVPVYLL